MFRNNERPVGIAVSSKLSPDASIAMEGWINGRLWVLSQYSDGNGLRHDSDGDHIFYWHPSYDFNEYDLDGLTKYLERYFEEDDPRPYLCDMERTQQYYYVGEHIDVDRKPLKMPENMKEEKA